MNNGTNNYNGFNNTNNVNYNPNNNPNINQNHYQNQIPNPGANPYLNQNPNQNVNQYMNQNPNQNISQNMNQNPNQNINQNNTYSEEQLKAREKKEIKSTIIGLLIGTGASLISGFYMNFVINNAAHKPIIYLYPEEETDITVKLGKPKNITCSYPKYNDGWNVIAKPNGTLIDKNTKRELYSLYWEGKYEDHFSMEEGFVVKGEDSAKFLEEKLEILGLNERETEEFIIYWLPQLEKNKYNFIRFASTEEINEMMPIEFSVEPDSVIRVLMQFKAINNKKQVKEQNLTTPERTGFVAVEWGGTIIK